MSACGRSRGSPPTRCSFTPSSCSSPSRPSWWSSEAWPAARRRLGILTPLVALVALVFVPLAKEAGEALERQVPASAVLERHTELGDQLLPWAIGLFVVAVGQWLWFRLRARRADEPTRSARPGARVATIAIAVVAVVVAGATTYSVVQVGDSGARAVWSSDGGDAN